MNATRIRLARVLEEAQRLARTGAYVDWQEIEDALRRRRVQGSRAALRRSDVRLDLNRACEFHHARKLVD